MVQNPPTISTNYNIIRYPKIPLKYCSDLLTRTNYFATDPLPSNLYALNTIFGREKNVLRMNLRCKRHDGAKWSER